MKTGFFRILLALICVFLLYGCAVIDKQLLDPASQHAKVNPLFRTADCKSYKMPTKKLISEIITLGFFDGGGGFFVKDPCEHQALAINDINDQQKDDLYKKMCKLDDADGTFVNKQGGARNCLNHLISRSDEICEIHQSHIYGDRTVMNTILGTLALGAGVAGSMTGVGAANYLSASAGFLTGGQALMDKEIYRNFVTHAILVKINTNRRNFLTGLAYLNEENDNTKINYGRVRRDAETYHNLCSFHNSLTSLLDEAGGSKKTEAVNAVLVSQNKLRKQSVESEIQALQTKLSAATTDDAKKAIQDKLDSRNKELHSIEEILALAALGEASTPGNDQPKVDNVKENSNENILIKDAQEILRKNGINPGPIDGKLGPKTRAAIEKFQKVKGLVSTGKLDKETITSLLASN